MTFMKEINMDYMLTACRYNYNAPDGKTYTLPADVMYKRAWVEEWYGKELGVMDVLTTMGWKFTWGPASNGAKVAAASIGPPAPAKPAGKEVKGADAMLTVGLRVRTLFPKSMGGDDKWHPGSIIDVFPENRTATIHYDNGFTWTGVSQVIYAA
mmetsp:Transcript_4693/g.12384  ORF Transcript_4693/g.12384 Transcript_4693/m.12384 type:complete len:154 (+) Transcript_4693:3-464(+)